MFEQAAIEVRKKEEFEQLKSAINRAFGSENVEKFLKGVASAGLRIRDFDSVLAKNVLEQVGALEKGRSAKTLYSELALTDRTQRKEFYLFKIEEVSPELRAKYQRIYQYY
jgi:hypothetical protein